MEFKIIHFVKWFAAFMAVWFSALVVDEFLKTKTSSESYKQKFVEETEFSDRVISNYFIETNLGNNIEVNRYVYDSIKTDDQILLYFSPLFHQLKGFEIQMQRSRMNGKFGNPNGIRNTQLFTGIPVVILCVLSAFVLRRFELRVAFFFFACLIAAVRWWIVGL